jgi:hypothetical protein
MLEAHIMCTLQIVQPEFSDPSLRGTPVPTPSQPSTVRSATCHPTVHTQAHRSFEPPKVYRTCPINEHLGVTPLPKLQAIVKSSPKYFVEELKCQAP